MGQIISAPKPPTSLKEWQEKRVYKRIPSINQEVETIIDLLWENPEFYKWFESTWDSEAHEGSSRADQWEAVQMVREYARANNGFPIAARAKKEAIYQAVTHVRETRKDTIGQRRKWARNEMAAAGTTAPTTADEDVVNVE